MSRTLWPGGKIRPPMVNRQCLGPCSRKRDIEQGQRICEDCKRKGKAASHTTGIICVKIKS